MKFLIILIGFPKTFYAQVMPKIDTDRPYQTECTSTVPKGYFQMENGLTHFTSNSEATNITIPSSLWKIGINDHFELRMITEPDLLLNPNSDFPLAPVKFGFKLRLVEEKGIIPNISFIAHLSTPFLSTENSRETNFVPDFRFTMDNTLSKTLSIGYNLGMRLEDQSSEPIFQYTCALGYTIGEKWKTYIEIYGDKSQNGLTEIATSTGVYYYPAPNIMFDFTPSIGLINSNLRHYFGLGFSFLIPIKKSTKI